jgi:hypothetical protein
MGDLWSNELELKKIELEREKEITKRETEKEITKRETELEREKEITKRETEITKRETEKEITKRMELELEKERYLGEQFCCACCLQSQD